MRDPNSVAQCLDSLETVKKILHALQTKAMNSSYKVNVEDRIKDIGKHPHGLICSCPELFESLAFEWIKCLDKIKHERKPDGVLE